MSNELTQPDCSRDDTEELLTACLERSEFLEQRVQVLRRQIEATQAKIAAAQAMQEGWHWTEPQSEQRRDN